MKKILFSIFFCCLLTTTQVSSLTVPAPIEGTPNITSRSDFVISAGSYIYHFKFPEGWGLGQTNASRDGHSFFELFPPNTGYGCSIEVESFDDEVQAQKALGQLCNAFNTVTQLENGFEVDLPKAWYSCRLQGTQVVQMWYSLPEKQPEHISFWTALENCLTLETESKSKDNEAEEFAPVTRVKGIKHEWLCNHPNGKLHVLFQAGFTMNCTPNTADVSGSHHLAFSDTFGEEGFFFVKWDQIDLDNPRPYAEHLNEILHDVLKVTPTQKVATNPTFNLEEGNAVLSGAPYTLISLGGDGFLFGFAVRTKRPFQHPDLNGLNRKVKWYTD